MKFAKKIIAHVNPAMPWTEGEGVFPVTDIDYFVEKEIPVTEFVISEVLSDTDTKIAEYVASLVHDGDTLQIGTGSVPDKVMKLLSNHKHLGIHSEMGSMGLMRLMQSGVIDNTCKTLDKGYSVFSLLAGFQELYDYVDHNPTIIMKPASYVTNPMIIAQQKNFVAINSAIQVDICSNSSNVIPGELHFTIDIRSNDFEEKQQILRALEQMYEGVERTRHVRIEATVLCNEKPALADEAMLRLMKTAAKEYGLQYHDMGSGAYHDAMMVSEFVPFGMIFVPSKEGIVQQRAMREALTEIIKDKIAVSK